MSNKIKDTSSTIYDGDISVVAHCHAYIDEPESIASSFAYNGDGNPMSLTRFGSGSHWHARDKEDPTRTLTVLGHYHKFQEPEEDDPFEVKERKHVTTLELTTFGTKEQLTKTFEKLKYEVALQSFKVKWGLTNDSST